MAAFYRQFGWPEAPTSMRHRRWPRRNGTPKQSERPKRGFWLTSLIVGTSLLVWLILISIVVGAVAVARQADNLSSNVPSLPSTPSPSSDSSVEFTDGDGYVCDYYDTDTGDLCPQNPSYRAEGT
jgi:hypothetical protein